MTQSGPSGASGLPSVRWVPGRDQLQLLGTLVDGGVRIDDALVMLEKAATDRATREGASVASRMIRSGTSLAETLGSLGAPRHVVASIASGERTGRLADALRGSATLVGEVGRMRASVRRALVYPGLILCIGLAMTVVIATTVIPSFERTFLQLGGELPFVTRIVLGVARPLGDPWVLVAPTAGLLVAGLLARRSASRRASIGTMRVVLRRLLADLDVAVLATLVARQLHDGVMLADALGTAADAIDHPGRRRAVHLASDGVRSGQEMTASQGLASVLRPAESELLAVAERTGALAGQWERVAAMRREQVEDRVARLTSTLEPILVLAVGLLVGGIILALYLPTFRILDLL